MSTNPAAPILVPPHGLDQIIATFGDIYSYIRPDRTLDVRWQSEFLTPVMLPFPLPLSWDKSRLVNQIRSHRLTAAVFARKFKV